MAFGVDDAALIGGIASVAAAGTSAISSGKLNKRTMRFNRQEAEKQRLWNEAMADKQNAWNYEMWMKQNEYNSPASQVERLRAAGLNPLFYGLDGSSAGEITAAQPLGYERAQISNLANPVAAGLDAAASIAQISNIRADTAKKTQETESEIVRREQMQQSIENAKQELLNMKAQEGKTKSEIAEIDKRVEWLDRLNEATVAEKDANAALNRSQKKRIDELLEGEKLLQVRQFEDFEHKWREIDAKIKNLAAQTGLAEKDIENYALNHLQNGFMGTGLSLPNLIRGAKAGGAKEKPGNENAHGDGMTPDDLRRSGQ